MKITDLLQEIKECQFTFEILPPLKGQKAQEIFDNLDPLMEFKPPFIDVTYHREETIYKRLDNGLLQEKVVRKRPRYSWYLCCDHAQIRYGNGSSRTLWRILERRNGESPDDLNFLGIENVVALRGDQAKHESYFTPHREGNAFAIDFGTTD